MNAAARSVDYIARLAEAWDGAGRNVLAPPFEHRALVALAGMRPEIAGLPWRHLKPEERSALLYAARRIVDMARACAWVFGEGQGA